MASWHQRQNPSAIRALWTPEKGYWKCISDKPNEMASAMVFDSEEAAKAYAAATGDVIIPPSVEKTV